MKQEKNRNGIVALLVIIIVVLLVLVVLLSIGTIDFKSNNNQTSENTNDNVVNNVNHPENVSNTKEVLTDIEISELNAFVSDVVNSQMAFVSFSDPSKLLETGDNSNYGYLTYIISSCSYVHMLS